MLLGIAGTPLMNLPWGEFSFDEELEHYNGSRLLLQRGEDGKPYLAWWNDGDDHFERSVCLPLSEAKLQAVLSGEIASRDAMEYPEDGYLLVVDIDLDTDQPARIVKTTAAALPQDTLPRPEARLNIAAPIGQPSDTSTPKVEVLVVNSGGDSMSATPIGKGDVPHSMFPASFLERLNIEPSHEIDWILSDGTPITRGGAFAIFRIENQEHTCEVIFGPEDSYLLGASTLAVFDLPAGLSGQYLAPDEWEPLGWGLEK